MALELKRFREIAPRGKPKFVSLFTGIGGMDLGLERAGLQCVAQVEINAWARGRLRQHWPRVPKFEDIRTFERSCIHGRVDLVAGGFPCQDISNAGKKAGITGARSGLWKEMLRVICDFQPSFVIVENVAALRKRGLDVVLADFAACGFDAEWDCLPAAAFGASHIRDRLFLVAYAKRLGWPCPSVFSCVDPEEFGRRASEKIGRTAKIAGRARVTYPRNLRVGDGLTAGVDRLRGCGNAVYPPTAEWIGRRLLMTMNRENGRRRC